MAAVTISRPLTEFYGNLPELPASAAKNIGQVDRDDRLYAEFGLLLERFAFALRRATQGDNSEWHLNPEPGSDLRRPMLVKMPRHLEPWQTVPNPVLVADRTEPVSPTRNTVSPRDNHPFFVEDRLRLVVRQFFALGQAGEPLRSQAMAWSSRRDE